MINTPKNWKNIKASELFKIQGGAAFKSEDSSTEGIRWLKIANVGFNKIKWNDISFLPESFRENYKNVCLEENDIVVAMTRPLLQNRLKIAKISKEDSPCLLNQRVGRILPNNLINKEFLYQLLRTKKMAYKVESDLLGTDPPNLSIKTFNNINIPIPPLPEQRAIADILSTWDEAIEKMDKLIEAKEKRYKTILHIMLDHPKDDWKEATLEEIGEISSAGVDKNTIAGEHIVRLLNYLDVYRKDLIYSDNISHVVTAPKFKVNKCNIKKGDVFFTPTSEVNYDIAHSAVSMEDISGGVYSYHVVRLRLKPDWDLYYRAFAFKSNYFYKQAYKYCDGSGQRYVISQNSFRRMKVYVPPLEEQKFIGKTLYLLQNEIKYMKELKNKYINQKRGLMQKLLTGEWSVKV